MSQSKKSIRVATRADMADIGELRVSEYRRAGEFVVTDVRTLLRDEHDDSDVILAAWDEADRVVSTMRGSVVSDRQEAEALLECSLPVDDSALPALVLGRAATRSDSREAGLNSALRYYFFSFALDAPVRSILGVVFAQAPRTQLMKSLGYVFHRPARTWRREVQAITPHFIACLERSRIPDGRAALRSRVASTLANYPWQGELPRFSLKQFAPEGSSRALLCHSLAPPG